jgi:hypothetical protein
MKHESHSDELRTFGTCHGGDTMRIPITLLEESEKTIVVPVGFMNNIKLEFGLRFVEDPSKTMRKAIDKWVHKHGKIPDLSGFLTTWKGVTIDC